MNGGYKLDIEYEKVKEFHKLFNQPIQDEPKFMPIERALIRAEWMKEEIDEFLNSEGLADQVDAMIDLIYYALGTMVELGVYPDTFFDIVHNANMKKINKDKIIYGPENKVLKPINWVNPKKIIDYEINILKEKKND